MRPPLDWALRDREEAFRGFPRLARSHKVRGLAYDSMSDLPDFGRPA